MANYIDDPNRPKVAWDSVTSYLVDSGMCSAAVVWWNTKTAKMQTELAKDKLTKPTKNDSNLNTLKELIADKHLDWAAWFIVQILDETGVKDYVKFAIEQIPKEVKDDASIKDAIDNAKSCLKRVEEEGKPSIAIKLVEYVVRVNALNNPDGNSDDVLLLILKNGVTLVEKAEK